MREPITGILCGICRGTGDLSPRGPCPNCAGEGRFARLSLAIKIVPASMVAPMDGPWWTRLAVLSSESIHGRTIAHGFTDDGRSISARLKPGALDRAKTATLLERLGWWS